LEISKKTAKMISCLGAPGLRTPCCGSSGVRGLVQCLRATCTYRLSPIVVRIWKCNHWPNFVKYHVSVPSACRKLVIPIRRSILNDNQLFVWFSDIAYSCILRTGSIVQRRRLSKQKQQQDRDRLENWVISTDCLNDAAEFDDKRAISIDRRMIATSSTAKTPVQCSAVRNAAM